MGLLKKKNTHQADPAHQAGASRRIERRTPDEYDAAAQYTKAAPQKSKGKPGGQKKKRHILRWVLLSAAACLAVGVAVLSASVLYSTRNDDLWLDLEQIPHRTETILYYTDRQTGETLEYASLPCTQNKTYVEGYLMPQNLKDAFVAIEDQNFYDHGGVSYTRTAYAILNEIKYSLTGSYIGDGGKQGASTINQQLVKNLTRDEENSGSAGYMRKLREMVRAIRMDNTYDKDTILAAYLNTISFTGNTAGVQAEAYKLFGKEVQQLTLPECASLAAITRNPARFNPVTNPETHLERRNYVLYEMQRQGYITQGEYDAAIATPLELNYTPEPTWEQPLTSYYTDMVMDAVVAQLVDERGLTRRQANDLLYNGGLRIYTTVDPTLQTAMEQVMQSASLYPRTGQTTTKMLTDENGQPLLDENGSPTYGNVTVYPQAAMVSLDYSGGVCAVVGGLGEKEISRGFNRGTSAVRQVGSTMKPISPYALALERNTITWSTPFLDAPVKKIKDKETGEMADWPTNATNTYSEKDVLVQDAMARSINTVAVRVGETVGTRRMYNFVKDELGISTLTSADRDLGPLVLGSSTYGITPLQLASAYAMYGNGGVVHSTYCYTQVTGGNGNVYLQTKYAATQAVSPDTAYIMNRLLMGVMEGNGTASGMWVRGQMESVGKTGTTSDHRDHWFVGLTPYYVTASWYGYDENLPLGVNSHWNPPILAWRAVMEQAQAGLPHKDFPTSNGVVTARYCTKSGYAASANCPSAEGYYKEDHLPEEGCPLHS